MTVSLVFLVLALICFILGAIPLVPPRVNWVSLGLAFWVLTLIVGAK